VVKQTRRKKRRKPHFRRQTKPGASPGTIAAHPDAPRPVIDVIAYDAGSFTEQSITNVEELPAYLKRYGVTWVNIDGLGDAAVIRRLGEIFHLHPLALEDVVNAHQRPKVEPYDEQLFIVARMVHQGEQLDTEQISIFLGPNYVLTFQEGRPGDCLNAMRERIRKDSGKIRRMKPDYLAYAILDAIIDSYFPLVEHYGDRLDALEMEMTANAAAAISNRIHDVRSDLLLLRRCVRPHREALNMLVRDPHPLIADETRIFLRDCYDHTIQLIDLLEVYRETCVDLRDFHISLVSNRMNEIMKVLTVIATIFMPLSFITGLYGMNFDTRLPGNMPELGLPYGYVLALGGMAAVAIGFFLYFYRKGWIGRGRHTGD
jgi:magnesium transporter